MSNPATTVATFRFKELLYLTGRGCALVGDIADGTLAVGIMVTLPHADGSRSLSRIIGVGYLDNIAQGKAWMAFS